MNTDMKHGKFLFLRWCRKNVRWCRKIAMVEKKYDGAGKLRWQRKNTMVQEKCPEPGTASAMRKKLHTPKN